jgi:phage-related protein
MTTQSEMTILLKLRDEASKGITKSGGVLDKYKTQLRAGAVAAAGAGVALEGLARKVAPLNESVSRLALQTGLTDKEIRGMAKSLSNATFPLDQVIGLMEQGAAQGIEGAAALQEYANFWDTVGDATGLSSERLAESGAALRAVGVEIGEEEKALKAFGLITNKTSGNVQSFMQRIRLSGKQLNETGITVDEFAILMTAMENELGLTADTAGTEFRNAIAQAERGSADAQKRFDNLTNTLAQLDQQLLDGVTSQAKYDEMAAVLNKGIDAEREKLEGLKVGFAEVAAELGLTEEQLAKYKGLLEESDGVIQANADAHAATKTQLEKLQSTFGDVMFTMGPFIQQAAGLAPILLAIAPAMAALSAAKGIYTTVTGIATVATTAFGVALKVAMGPVGLIVIAITGLIAIGVLLWKNWDEVSAKAKEIWGAIVQFFNQVWDTLVGIFRDNWKMILGILFPAFGIALLIKKNWGAIVGVVKGIWDNVIDVVKGAINHIIGLINKFINGVNKIQISFPGVSIPFAPDIPGFNIGLPRIPNIPTLAKGAITNGPALAVVGDNPGGRELIMPLPRGGGGGGLGVTINGPLVAVSGNLVGSDLADVMEQGLAELERRGVILRAA